MKKRSRGKGFDALQSLVEKRAGSARLMRGDGKNVRVRRGSMSEDLGGGEGGLNPLDALGTVKKRLRGKGFDALQSLAEEKAGRERRW